ncbi:MAG TPA: DNA primase [Candidatus Limnocylindrales bacterium]|nr:DNA primase [Candidatus Limnocylindrales bacterium]
MSVGATAEVKSKLSVVEVVGETVTLKKAGTTYKGLCPFHGEKTPSFVVTPARETWHCFGCGLGGDIFSFVMQRDGSTFPEALRTLAARAGVEIDERTKREDARRARLRQVLDTAIAFYHAVLTGSKAGQPALAYLNGRGFTDQTIETFQLGWAPAGWEQMARQLQTKRDIRGEELVEVGLASPSQRGRGVIDKFRARVIFPIRDANGHAVGLGGRLLEGEGPKYLNSPATPLFDKSRTLYLIDKAKGPIRKADQAVIVEGYTDALMAHQAGFENVVASLGTALTPGQVALLTRYAKRIALAYDVDAAGERAGTLGVQALAGLIGQLQGDDSGVKLEDVRVVRLPAGKDPDEVVREDPAVWSAGIAKAKPLVEYLIDHHAGRFDLKTPTGRIGFVDAVMPSVRDIADPLRRDEALQQVRRVSGVEERVLRQVLDRRIAAAGGTGTGADRQRSDAATRITADAVLASPDALPIADILRAVTPVEAELIRLLLLVPDQQLRVVDELGPDQLPSTLARELFRAIVLQRAPDDQGIHPPFDGAALLLAVDDETASLARALYAKPGPDPRSLDPRHLAYEITRLLLELEDDQLRERSDYNEAAQAEAERAGDAATIDRLMLERRQINEARRSLDRRRDETRLLARPTVAARA